MLQTLTIQQTFHLESGETLPEIEIAYQTYGKLNAQKDNVIWVFHALTGNADAADWWNGLIGEGRIFDPENYFIVCANMLGSCYGATHADSIHPSTGEPYGKHFPLITVRDMVASHRILQQHLGIEKVFLGIGGSMGGQQLLEWAIIDPNLFENIVALATNAEHSSWGIAFNEAQRMAIRADETLYADHPEAGKKGIEAARAIGMLSYRNYDTFNSTQYEQTDIKLNDFRAASYQRYQGTKLWQRFSPRAYLTLSQAMDSHNVGRNRGGVPNALRKIEANALVIGIKSDILFPVQEQIEIAKHIRGAHLILIESLYGHDGFLIENQSITEKVKDFLSGKLSRVVANNVVPERLLSTVLPGTEAF